MDILDPFLFAPGDFTLFNAATLELSTRKLLTDSGYRQELFHDHIDMLPAIKGVRNYYAEDNFQEALRFTLSTLRFLGFTIIRRNRQRNESFIFAVKLPRSISWDEQFPHYFEENYEINLRGSAVFFRIWEEETCCDWLGLVDVIHYFIKVKEMLKQHGTNGFRGERFGYHTFKKIQVPVCAFRRRRGRSYRKRSAA